MVSVARTARPVQPAALYVLQEWLHDSHYSPWCAERIVAHVEAEGELAGAVAVGLDPEDEAPATEVYVEALDPVCPCSPEWGNATGDESMFRPMDDVWTPTDAFALTPPELEGPCEPTAEDLADYARWAARLEALDADSDFPRDKSADDRRRDMLEVREWYAAHPGE
jgi:hypothetical protein